MLRHLKSAFDLGALRKRLALDLAKNSGFLWRAFHSGDVFRIYSVGDMGATMAIEDSENHLIFAGDWSETDIPDELLPVKGAFVSASPLSAIEKLKEHYEPVGEWPCWHFLAPVGYGPGEWDELGPLKDGDVSYVAKFWELGGDDREEHIRDCVKRFDSACVRIDSKPVSWCGLHFEFDGVGNLGFAHTLEEHRRKGLARTVTKALVNRLATKGSRATSDVIKDNAASIAVCKLMGFEVIGELAWADFKRKD
ncbi:MAG: GNAT family N-acetyltransferase [Candidatus Thermoplasmatota archaeon]|nr:GNAT family N-acetyltransferase [Euryarchaeota archaeon]MBU4032546.1 GNAT family N-acetyltransferase [Candidatus Thermoplasmatota archaeon]MBU4072019.1 GNAT family N-acetyltransferase [Candidatus Thermoplasmatota archaeon]MBU4144550.1 GNAT family N-acetyltransferase [Candidatus Thermoplasmatota archaeon]MBU4592099.1 GNAT family N-acetyltransferase [Candidatus Thermoplasmatota archaeon]